MILPEHKFIIEKISPVDETKKNKKKFVSLILKKNAPTDELGDKIGEDDLLCVTVWEKQFDQLEGLKKGDKVTAQLWMNCSEKLDQNSSKLYYSVGFSLKSIKPFNPESKQ